ncbi:MAG: hypothetical protein PVF73_07570 [Bacteroidales bacterium]|jgi:hypothetical protein
MSIHFQRFLIKNIVATLLIILSGALVFRIWLPAYFHFFYFILVLLAFAVNLMVFYTVTKRGKEPKDKSATAVIKAFAIKFFSYLVFALLFLVFTDNPDLKITYVILLFFLYIIYTTIEITSILKFFKTGEE